MNLDEHLRAYANDPFERENALTIAGMIEKIIRYATERRDYLELGIGHGIAIELLSEGFERLTVLEGSSQLVRSYRPRFPRVRILETFFESYQPESKFHNIGMGFILEHVDDPESILRRYREFLAHGGHLFVGVPNAASLHRLLGRRMGLLPDISALSEVDRAFGHKRYLEHGQWRALFASAGYRVVREEGLYLKPLTTRQLDLAQLAPEAHRALLEISADYPAISNSCFFQLGHA